jgi:hypothetical protein
LFVHNVNTHVFDSDDGPEHCLSSTRFDGSSSGRSNNESFEQRRESMLMGSFLDYAEAGGLSGGGGGGASSTTIDPRALYPNVSALRAQLFAARAAEAQYQHHLCRHPHGLATTTAAFATAWAGGNATAVSPSESFRAVEEKLPGAVARADRSARIATVLQALELDKHAHLQLFHSPPSPTNATFQRPVHPSFPVI